MQLHGVYILRRHIESKFEMFSVKSRLYSITSPRKLATGKYLFNFNCKVTRTKCSAHTLTDLKVCLSICNRCCLVWFRQHSKAPFFCSINGPITQLERKVFVMFLRNLIPLCNLKNVKNTLGGVLLLEKLQASSQQLY